jgi:hypothetical protein
MSSPSAAAPPRFWTRFAFDVSPELELPSDARIDRYEITDVRPVIGSVPDLALSARTITRVESPRQLLGAPGNLAGVTGHVVYTVASVRRELVAVSSGESGPVAVLIPIAKSAAWWAMAQDERIARFHAQGSARGHFAIGTSYASRIFRRLYHARYLPEAEWDFLTYFEFPRAQMPTFRALLAELRDPQLNPEWAFVERELEIWMTKR